MRVTESILIALFCVLGVFIVLIGLSCIIKLFSFVLGHISKKMGSELIVSSMSQGQSAPDEDFSSGALKLINVDEPTAAMIMAIVSDQSGIPLSELCFKSIKLLQHD
ncbi:MAG: OadG family protein [Clostridiales bacterium]|nr:OadG family protein [Clostridiales bacterium]